MIIVNSQFEYVCVCVYARDSVNVFSLINEEKDITIVYLLDINQLCTCHIRSFLDCFKGPRTPLKPSELGGDPGGCGQF